MQEFTNGYAGRILRINLTTGGVEDTPTESYSPLFLGGRGIAAKLYWDEVSPAISPFDAQNRLIFITGPVTATTGFCGSRWQVCGKSPVHNTFSYCNLGGNWGAQLKRAGYDGLVVTGQAEGPVYLWITNHGVEIRRADHLSGQGAITCRETLKKELGRTVNVVAIGPAGENRVVYANLIADQNASGAGGLAAVMGAKNLKAIAVKGGRKVVPADANRLLALKERSLAIMSGLDEEFVSGVIPFRDPISFAKTTKDVCYSCTGHKCIRRNYRMDDGQKGKFMCGSSYFYMIWANLYYGRATDVPFQANQLCDDYGIDTHVMEPMLVWLANCRQAGILTEEETGLPFSNMGSLEFIDALVKKISYRDGIGDILAEGTHKAAKALGRKAQSLTADFVSRNDQRPFYGPRAYLTTGLFYAMEPRLAIQQLHEVVTLVMRWSLNEIHKPEKPGVTTATLRAIAKRFWGSELAADFSTWDGKALAAAKIQDRQHAKESLILCDFNWPIMYSEATVDNVGDPTLESQICSAVTGKEVDEEGLYRIGERVFNLQRAILIREGWQGRADDALDEFEFSCPASEIEALGNPEALIPGEDGRTISRKGLVVDRKQFEGMKDEFYALRGWDIKTGLQKKTTLEALDLADVARTMETGGFLA
jgi:aldehyde:ferredoxin oxidoreductase